MRKIWEFVEAGILGPGDEGDGGSRGKDCGAVHHASADAP